MAEFMESCRANIWSKQHPRKKNEAWMTETKLILPRRDFGPLSTLSSFHNRNLSSFDHSKNPCRIDQGGNTDTTSHQGKLHLGEHLHHLHHYQDTRRSCRKKVLPSPDGQRLWLVLGTPLTTVET